MADEDLSTAMVSAFRGFEGDEATLAASLRSIEKGLYTTLDVASKDVVARSAEPVRLSEADVAQLEPRPEGADPADALAVATSALSPHPIEAHATIALIADQAAAGTEPASPSEYDRTFLEGEDCFAAKDCAFLRTSQHVTKEYTLGILPPITYDFFKNYRWVDLNAGTDAGTQRWGLAAQVWNPAEFSSENGKNVIHQSWTVEAWFPRDGTGFRCDDLEADGEVVDSDAPPCTTDSDGDGGIVRVMVLWTDTDAGSDDETTVVGVIRWGIDQIFQAHDDFLEAQAEE